MGHIIKHKAGLGKKYIFTIGLFLMSSMGCMESADNVSRETDKNERIAIVGAGTSGITAGYLLRKKGYKNLTIFEKNDYIGGKNISHIYEDRIYDLGSLWFPSSAKTFLSMAKEFEIEIMDYSSPYPIILQSKKVVSVVENIKRQGVWAGIKSVLSYLFLMINNPFIYNDKVVTDNNEFYLPMNDFLKLHPSLVPLFKGVEPFMVGCGYGYYDETPAIFILKTMSPVVYVLLTSPPNGNIRALRIKGGAQEVFKKAAGKLKIFKNQEVLKVERLSSNGNDKIVVSTKSIVQEFDKIIISCSPYSTLKFLDVSKEEQGLLEKVKGYNFVSSLVKVEGLPKKHVLLIEETAVKNRINHIGAIDRLYPDQDVVVTYQITSYDSSFTDINNTLKSDLQKIGGKNIEIIKQMKFPNYFSHPDTDALSAGFYEDVYALQGKRGTYYLGGWLNMETVGYTTQYAKELIDEHF